MTKWAPEHDRVVRENYNTDCQMSYITTLLWQRFGVRRSVNAVIGRAHRLGLVRDDDTNRLAHQMRQAGVSQSEMGLALGMSRNAANGRALRHERALQSDARDLQVCKMIDEGHSTLAIQRATGTGRTTIDDLRRELDKLDRA